MSFVVRFHVLPFASTPAAKTGSRERDDEMISLDVLQQSPPRVFIDLLKYRNGLEYEGHLDFVGRTLLDHIAYRRLSIDMQQWEAGIQEIDHVLVDVAGVVARTGRERHPGDSQWIKAAGDIQHRTNWSDFSQEFGIETGQKRQTLAGRGVGLHDLPARSLQARRVSGLRCRL